MTLSPPLVNGMCPGSFRPLVRRDGEQHIHLHNNEDETPERVREKVRARTQQGIVLQFQVTAARCLALCSLPAVT